MTQHAASSTSPFAVGSTTLFIHDATRPYDSDAGVITGIRTLITEVWYPVEHAAITAGLTPATYGDYVFGNRDVHHLMMTQTTNFHLTLDTAQEGVSQTQIDAAINELFDRYRGSYTDAPPAASGTWPVVVVTHGDAGSRYNMQTVSEYLAAHGYLVIAPEHTGNSPFSMTGADPALNPTHGDSEFKKQMADVLPLLDSNGVYGSADNYGQSYSPLAAGASMLAPEGIVNLDNSLLERVNDLRAALTTLEQLNTQGRFAGKIDMSRIGLMGRSFGGATTLAGLALEDRFKAGVAVAPPSMPDLRPLLPTTALVAPPAESAIRNSGANTAFTQLYKPTLLIEGSEDQLLLGIARDMAAATNGTPPTPAIPYPTLQATFAKSAVPALFATLQNTNHASLSTAGPYWWPELKPRQLSRFFAPDEQFTLTNAATVHRVQQEMVLAFFDAMLAPSTRDSDAGKTVLRENPWSAHNTGIQLKEF